MNSTNNITNFPIPWVPPMKMNFLLSTKNPVFRTFTSYAIMLILKMITMSFLTAIQRFRKKVFIAPEDLILESTGQVKYDDPDVERVRRAHMNDLENIPIFLITGILFIITDPNKILAETMFRIYATARILHTTVYCLIIVPQPARAMCFFAGAFVNIAMASLTIMSVFHL